MKKCLEKLIQEKNQDQHDKEVHLSKNYNEFLLYGDIIEKICVSQHYRILKMAINNQYGNFPYDSFASFIISQLEKGMNGFSILMKLVDISKIKREDLLKIAKLTDFEGSPFKLPNDYLLKCICDDKQETEKNFDILTTLINSGFNEIKQQLKEIIDQKKEFKKTLSDIKSEISDIQKSQNSLKSKISNVNKNITSEIPEMANIIKSEISEIIDIQKKYNDENKDFIQKQISDAKDKNSELLLSTINEFKNKIKDLQTKNVDLILSKEEENQKSINSQLDDIKKKFPLNLHCSSYSKIENVFNFLMFKDNLPLKVDHDIDKNGIFITLNSEFGNPFKNKLFDIYGNSEKGYEDKLNDIIGSKYHFSNLWVSKDEKNSYIKIDFRKYQFRFKSIVIESGKYDGNIIGDFTVEGLNTGNSWNTINSWNNDENYNPIYAFLGDFTKESYRYIRIRMNGPNSSGNNRLYIKELDLYGILSERAKV